MGLTATLLPAIRNITMLAVKMMRVATVVILIKEIMCSGFYMVYTSNSQNLVCITIYIYIYFFFLGGALRHGRILAPQPGIKPTSPCI